jgi:hypothetical protein
MPFLVPLQLQLALGRHYDLAHNSPFDVGEEKMEDDDDDEWNFGRL